MSSNSKSLKLVLTVVFFTIGFGLRSLSAEYKEIPWPDWVNDRAAYGKLKFEVRLKIFNSPSGPSSADEDKLRLWFVDYHLRRLTHLDKLEQLPDHRVELQKDFNLIKAQATRGFVNDMVLKVLLPLSTGDYHPATRVNALLLMGDLDAEPLNQISKRLPVPYSPATTELLNALKNPEIPDGMKPAAVKALLRHAKFGKATMPAGVRNALSEAMIAIVNSKPTQGADLAAHMWMQRRAIDILVSLEQPGPSGEVPKAILVHALSPDSSSSMRCSACNALGKLEYGNVFKTDGAKALEALAQFAVASCQAELAAIDEARAARPNGPEPSYLLDRSQRRLIYKLAAVQRALTGQPGAPRTGLRGSVAQADAQKMSQLAGAIAPIIAGLEQADTVDNLKDEIGRGSNALQRFSGQQPTAPALPADPAEPKAPADPLDPGKDEDVLQIF